MSYEKLFTPFTINNTTIKNRIVMCAMGGTALFERNGFNDEAAELFQQKIIKRNRFAFVASEFEKIHEKTDHYFRFFLNMFEEKGIHFDESYVVDGRMTALEAQEAVAKADSEHQKRKKPVSATPRTTASKNKFNNFDQRSYDYDQLEKMLLTSSAQ